MELQPILYVTILLFTHTSNGVKIGLPSFKQLRVLYPGHKHFGGQYSHSQVKDLIGTSEKRSLHDTSALRLSYSLNKIGGNHSLGTSMIQLSRAGHDSISGKAGFQYIYNPIAFGPYLADKYGYPTVSRLHQTDPIATKKRFYGKQGILEIITYTKKGNKPKGHIVLWDCDHIHQEKDWISKHHLITVEFWQSPDSNCEFQNEQNIDNPVESTEKRILLSPVPFGVPRVDTVRFYNQRLQHLKVTTTKSKDGVYKKIRFNKDVYQ